MSKEYTYSMPESFMKDQSVPARWRILGVVNGFSIAGKGCWASNEWFMKELNCSEQTVSNGFKELETLGEIFCKRTKRTRVAYRLRAETLTDLGLTPKATGGSDPNQLGTISDSISDSNTSELEDEIRVVEVSSFEGEEKAARKPAKYPHALEVFSWFPRPQQSWKSMKNVQEREYAEFLYLRGESKVRSILKYIAAHEDDEHFYRVTKPSDLEKKWADIVAYSKKN